MITLWITPARAKALGCTHKARFMWIIPGFFEPDQALWVPRSDLFAPIEYLLFSVWAAMHRMRGEEPDFVFELTGELE